MTIDQHELSSLAEDLHQLYIELDRCKHERQQAPRGERVMKPAPGPREPAAGWAISLDAQLSAELKEMVRDAINYTDAKAIMVATNGAALCRVIRSNAMEISENFPAVDDLADLMRDQVRHLTHKLSPRLTIARRPEPRQLAEVIVHKLHRMGHAISTTTLRTWASKGIITSELRGRRATYLMTEVLDWITRDTPER